LFPTSAATISTNPPDSYLHESARQFLDCVNRAAEFCWSDDSYTECVTANSTARDALYDELRDETDLIANLVQEAIRRAVRHERVRRTMETGQASEPTGVHVTEYAVRQAERDLYRDRVSLSTVNGRVKGDFELPADSLTPYERYVLSEDVEQDVIWTVPTPGDVRNCTGRSDKPRRWACISVISSAIGYSLVGLDILPALKREAFSSILRKKRPQGRP